MAPVGCVRLGQSDPIAKICLVITMSLPIGARSLDIPDNITTPQFFNASHVSRPSSSNDTPCLVDEQTGQTLSFTDVSAPLFVK